MTLIAAFSEADISPYLGNGMDCIGLQKIPVDEKFTQMSNNDYRDELVSYAQPTFIEDDISVYLILAAGRGCNPAVCRAVYFTGLEKGD